jgi:hypothetical protein
LASRAGLVAGAQQQRRRVDIEYGDRVEGDLATTQSRGNESEGCALKCCAHRFSSLQLLRVMALLVRGKTFWIFDNKGMLHFVINPNLFGK